MKIDLRNQRPKVEKLPDGRLRATFVYDVLEQVGRTQAELTAEVWLAWGTVAPVDFTGLRLIKQDLDGTAPNKNGSLPLVRVYEELPATAEIQVGANAYSYPEDGGKTTVAEFIQFTAGTYAPGTVGTSTAPGDATSYLQNEDATSDGTLRRIKRTYTDTGELSVTNETKNNGALLMRTIVSVKTVPSTPGGYTLISTAVKNTQGLPTYTYTFAKGVGEISRRYSTPQGGTAEFDPADWSLAVGPVRCAITHLTAPSVTADPITRPTGFKRFSLETNEQDGYLLWIAEYGYASGVAGSYVVDDYEIKMGGKLYTYRRVCFNTTAAAPGATLVGSTMTHLGTTAHNDSGTVAFTSRWVECIGEISRNIDYSQSGDQGTTGVTRTTIRHLVAPSATVQPTTLAGSIKVDESYAEEDGYRVWTTTWAKGTGEVSRDIDYSQSSDAGVTGLTRTTIRHLVAPAATVQPTTLAESVLVGKSVSEADGHRVWTTVWAKGTGTIRTSTSYRNNGKLTVYRKTAIGAAPSAPTITGSIAGVTLTDAGSGYSSAPTVSFSGGGGSGATATAGLTGGAFLSLSAITVTAGGTGYSSAPTVSFSAASPGPGGATATATLATQTPVEISSSTDEQDGVTLYTKEWALGSGVIDIRTNGRGDGLRTETWTSVGPAYDASFMLPPGILLAKDSSEEEGTKRWLVTCIQNSTGTSPLVGTTVASVEITNLGNYYYGSAPTVTFSGGGGSGAVATAAINGSGVVTGITVSNKGSGYTSAPLVTLSGGTSDVSTCVAILSNGAVTQDKLMRFTYPGRAQAVKIDHPDALGSAYNLDIQLSPPIDALVMGVEEVSYRAANDLTDLTYPLWSPTEWATMFAQYVDGANYISKCEGMRGYRAIGGSSSVQNLTTTGFTSVLGNPVTNTTGKSAYLKVFGGPDSPDGKTFTLEADCELAFIGYTGTRYYRRVIRYASIPTQAAMPSMTTAGIAIISSTVTNLTTLRDVPTVGVTVGGRTNFFAYTWSQGGILFTRSVRGTLVAGTLTNETTFYIRPTDNATSAKYWVLT